MNNSTRLKLLLIKEKQGWTGQVLDVNVAFQFEYLIDLKASLIKAVEDAIEVWSETGGYGENDHLPEAPSIFWKMHAQGRPLREYIDQKAADLIDASNILADSQAIDGGYWLNRDDAVVTEREACPA